MRQKSQTRQTGAAKAIKGTRRATRKQYSAEEKIRIVLDAFLQHDISRNSEHWSTNWPESRIAVLPLIVKLCRKA